MIGSNEQLFSDDQVVTASAASTNVIDLGAVGTVVYNTVERQRDVGKGRPIPIAIRLTATPSGTSPTLDVTLESSTDEAFTSPKTIDTSVQLAPGVAGDEATIFYVKEKAEERFLRLNYATGGTSPSYTVWAGIVLARDTAEKS